MVPQASIGRMHGLMAVRKWIETHVQVGPRKAFTLLNGWPQHKDDGKRGPWAYGESLRSVVSDQTG